MTTSRTCALVSLVVAMLPAVGLGACVSTPPREAEALAPPEDRLRVVRFDNDGRHYVHVYLVGERREWLLGRVEPGAVALLRIPAAAFSEPLGLVRLAVIADGHMTLRAARHPHARVTAAQPVSHILSQKWWFAQGQLSSTWVPGARRTSGSM